MVALTTSASDGGETTDLMDELVALAGEGSDGREASVPEEDSVGSDEEEV